MDEQIDTLILVFAPGGSLTRWASLGRLEREKHLLSGLGQLARRVLFISQGGADDVHLARALSLELAMDIDAITSDHPDPELGGRRPLPERVLARLDGARRVVIQTMQLQDGGLSASVLGPLRRAGVQAALVARGAFVESRVKALSIGPHDFDTLRSGADEQALCRLAQIVVGASPGMIEDLAWRYGINPARTRVIPHFVPEGEQPPAAGERERGLVLSVGHLEPSRGVDTVIAALARLPDQLRQQTRLRVVGDGPEGPTLRAEARRQGVTLELTGRLSHNDVLRQMRACAVFVHASPLRAQSRAVLEAMAQGCPVVVTDTPELDGLVENASNGIRVKRSVEAFAFAIAAMLTDQDWREMLGSTAARTIRLACGLDRIVRLSRECYADALALSPESVPGRSRRAG